MGNYGKGSWVTGGYTDVLCYKLKHIQAGDLKISHKTSQNRAALGQVGFTEIRSQGQNQAPLFFPSVLWCRLSAWPQLSWLQDGHHGPRHCMSHTTLQRQEKQFLILCISCLKAEKFSPRLSPDSLLHLPFQIWVALLNCYMGLGKGLSSPVSTNPRDSQALWIWMEEKITFLFLLPSDSSLAFPLNMNISIKSQGIYDFILKTNHIYFHIIS